MEKILNKNERQTNQPKINLIGCDTIVNSPSQKPGTMFS